MNRNPKITWWRDPFLWAFVLLAITGAVVSAFYSGAWLDNLLILPTIVSSILILFLTQKYTAPPIAVPRPSLACWAMLAYYCLFLIFNILTRGKGLIGNDFEKWLWFVLVPLMVLFFLHGRNRNIKELFKSIGFRKQGLGKALLLASLAYALFIPILPFILPPPQWQSLQELFREPSRLVVFLPLCFLLSLFTAGTTEEIFFRGILQSRLARLMRSELRSCLIIAFMFGIYHLPYAYYSSSWPSHGNILWAVAGVLSEQMIMGALLGILWWRTHNIAAPILLHTLVNLASIMASIKFG